MFHASNALRRTMRGIVMTVRRYHVASESSFWFGLAGLVFMFATGVWVMSKNLSVAEGREWKLGFAAVYFSFVVYGAYSMLTSAKSIVVLEGDELEFVAALEKQRIHARDIHSIELTYGRRTVSIVVRHAAGKIQLGGPMNDFSQFVTDLKQANPAVQTEGC